jgi:hypothetical protein
MAVCVTNSVERNKNRYNYVSSSVDNETESDDLVKGTGLAEVST